MKKSGAIGSAFYLANFKYCRRSSTYLECSMPQLPTQIVQLTPLPSERLPLAGKPTFLLLYNMSFMVFSFNFIAKSFLSVAL